MEDFKGDIQIVDGELYMTGNAIDRLHEMKKRIGEIAGEELKLFKVDIATDNTLIGVGNVLESKEGIQKIEQLNILDQINSIKSIGLDKVVRREGPSRRFLNVFQTESGGKFYLKQVSSSRSNSGADSNTGEFFLIGGSGDFYFFIDGRFQRMNFSSQNQALTQSSILLPSNKNLVNTMSLLESKGYRTINIGGIINGYININTGDLLEYAGKNVGSLTKSSEGKYKIKSRGSGILDQFDTEQKLIEALGI